MKMVFSFLIFYLFQAVHQQKLTQAYIYCAILCFSWYCSQLTGLSYATRTNFIVPRMKAALSMFLYLKVTKLNTSLLKSQWLGTIMNLINNDLSLLD